jgi:beta-glucosidase
LTSILGIASIEGSQGSGDLKNKTKVAACLKHYIGYSYPLNGRDRSASWIPDIILREYFLPSFAAGVKAGIKTAMINSGFLVNIIYL